MGIGDNITVVTGLPRSGTSMVMQMLDAGGFPLLYDDARPSDSFNPRGYYEYAPVKGMAEDSGWLPKAEGKAVKIVAPLVPYLPETHSYRFIVVERELDAVLASQERMVGHAPSEEMARTVRAATEKCLLHMESFIGGELERPVLRMIYDEVVENPRAATAELAAFLENPFDARAAERAIIKSE